jgi:transcriptional regulatory protein RtcR
MKQKVVLGFLGTQLDSGAGAGRWEKWRPTVSLGSFEDFVPDRVELWVDLRRRQKLADQVREDLLTMSPHTEVVLHDCYVRDPWDFEEMYSWLLDFVRAYAFDTEANDYLVHITPGTHVAQICLFLLTEARFLPGQLLQTSPPPQQKRGAAGIYSIIDLDLARYDQIAQRFDQSRTDSEQLLKSGIATRSPAFNRMIEQIERVASRSKAPMLLMGPTGAGKSMLARNLYQLKQARQSLKGRFVEVNCATLRGDGAGSALFGHVKGAYTGAQSDRAGLLKSADGGLLFLDEVGELGLDEQAMLLRAIEDKRFPPMGGDKEVSSDFQLIAGTNRDLAQAVSLGRFRDDLYARLNLWTFDLPSLRERLEDIEPNLDFELERYARLHNERISYSREARTRYLNFATSAEAPWTGNFRDLGASIMRMATLAQHGRITVEVVDEEIGRLRRSWGQLNFSVEANDIQQHARTVLGATWDQLDRFDQSQLADVLAVCRQSRSLSDAGRALFQASRARKRSSNDADRLKKYLARFGLSFERLSG